MAWGSDERSARAKRSRHNRSLRVWLLLLAASASLFVFASCSEEEREGVEGLGEVLTALQREQLSFSVLAVNLQGNHPDHGDDTAGWIERQGRIADWMAATNTRPDLIALQEVHGRSGDVQTYEMLFRLVSRIAERTGATYRIAYLVVRPVPQGFRPTLWAGNALLYNADRVTNRTVARPSDVPLRYTDETTLGVHMRQSLACENPPAEFVDSCALIDGSGSAQISSFRGSDGRWQFGPVFARLQLKAFPGLLLHVYSVHVQWQKEEKETGTPTMFLAEVNRLIPQMEGDTAARRLYPPIVLGDFNLGR